MSGIVESLAVNIAASVMFELGRTGIQTIRQRYGLDESLFERQLQTALSKAASHLGDRVGYATVEAFFKCDLVKNYVIEYFNGSSPKPETLEAALHIHLDRDWLVFRELDARGFTISQVVGEFLDQVEQTGLELGGLGHVIIARKIDELRNTRANENLDLVRRLSLLIEATIPDRWSLLREGKRSETIAWVREIRSVSTIWNNALSSDLKAKLLRLEAFAEIQKPEGLARAKRLSMEANALAQSAEGNRLEARICFLENGPVTALELLDDTSDVDCLNMKAALLLDLGQITAAIEVLNHVILRLTPTPETFRLRAVYHILTGKVPQALADADQALSRAPRWLSLKYNKALVGYLSTISVAALPDRVPAFPKPLPLTLMKTSPADLDRMSMAGEMFQELAESPGVECGERRQFQTWALACLGSHPHRQNEAQAYSQAVLEGDPTNPYIITWVTTRNWAIDITASQKALHDALVANHAHASEVIALFGCLVVREDVTGLFDALAKSKELFESEGDKEIWHFWRLQACLLAKDLTQAEQCLDILRHTALEPIGQEVLLRYVNEQSGDGQPLAAYLQQEFERTKHPVTLYKYCEVLARLDRWPVVAEFATQLVETVGTASAVNLAVTATFNAGRYSVCLRLLEDYHGWFVDEKLPAHLRLMQVACKKNLGIIPQAVADAQDLVREHPSVTNLLALAEVYASHGDFLGVVFVARQLISKPNVAPEQCLRLAKLVKWNDKPLSEKLFRKAMESNDLPGQVVGSLILIGFEMGIDRELSPILSKLNDAAVVRSYGFWQASVEEAADIIRAQRENAIHISEAYQQGRIPIHLAVQQLNLSLASIYHMALELNEHGFHRLPATLLYIRHGSRTLMASPQGTKHHWRLNMDVTAILLASHLGILERVVAAFGPVNISSHLVAALTSMRDLLAPRQPTRIEAYRMILRLVAQHDLRVVADSARMGATATEDGRDVTKGYVVDFAPAEENDGAVSCRDVVDSLRHYGPLGQDEYLKAVEALGTAGAIPRSNDPLAQGKPLLLRANIPAVLASADLLALVCERFVTFAEQTEILRVTDEVNERDAQDSLAGWLGQVIESVRGGIAEGYIRVLPVVNRNESLGIDDDSIRSPEVRCLLDLLSFSPSPNDIIWVDDRHIHGYMFRDSVPIVGIMEILTALIDMGQLSRVEYYRIVNKLQASGVLFIPLTAEEILHHLNSTRIQGERVVETHELEVMRNYVSTCLAHGAVLQRPQGEARPGEIPFLLSFGHEVVQAISGVWNTSEVSVEVLRSRADWILENLYMDQYVIALMAEIDIPGDKLYLSGLGLAALLAAGLSFDSRGRMGLNTRKDYFSWVYERVLRHRFQADPHLITVVGDHLKKLMMADDGEESSQENLTAEQLRVARLLVTQRFYEDLPEVVQHELDRDSEFMATLGFEEVRVVHILGHDIENATFVMAVSEAVNGRLATCLAMDGISVGVEPHPTHKYACQVTLREGQLAEVTNEILEILLEDPTLREVLVHRNRKWFDCSTEDFRRLVSELVTDANPVKRLAELDHWRQQSVFSYYENLRSLVRNRSALSPENFQFPSVDKLSWFLRLPPGGTPGRDFGADMKEAAATLLDEEDLVTAIHRLSGIPVAFPIDLARRLLDLGEAERKATIKTLLALGLSPIAQSHLMRLLNQMPEIKYKRLARWLAHRQTGEAGEHFFSGFIAVLKWVASQSEQWSVAPTIRLAMVWAHAHLVYSTLTSERVRLEWIERSFQRWGHVISLDTFRRPQDYWYDIAHPRNVSPMSLLMSGLGHGLGTDSSVLDDSFKERILELVFPLMGTTRFPAVGLLRSPTQYPNQLGSFLGDNRGESLQAILGAETASILSSEAINMIIGVAVQTLEADPAAATAWAIAHGLYAGGSQSSELITRMAQVIRETDFLALYRQDQECARIALITSAIHIGLTSDGSLRGYLVDQLLAIARTLEDSQKTIIYGAARQEFVSSALSLMEAALDATVVQGDVQATMTGWAELLTRILAVAPSLGNEYRNILEEAVRVLPVGACQHAWKMLNLARGGRASVEVE